jgi:hypothetical protein
MAVEEIGKTAIPEKNCSKDPAATEAYALEQYEKILRFHDAILSGKHATIKVPLRTGDPEHLVEAATATSQRGLGKGDTEDGVSLAAKARQGDEVVSQLPAATSSEFNPVLLEKSDELIRAEIQLQRQRLERALREEVEQRRASRHTQPEHGTDLDPSAILAQAWTIVQETAPLPQKNEDSNATNGAESDSFDNNTFYSSQHDTDESRLASVARHKSADSDAQNAPVQGAKSSQNVDNAHPNAGHEEQHVHATNQAQANQSYSPPQSVSLVPQSVVPGLNNLVGTASFAAASQAASYTAGETTGKATSAYPNHSVPGLAPLQSDSYAQAHPPSPLLRGHNSVPGLGQLSQAPTYDVAAAQLNQYYSSNNASVGTPAQVAALRSGPASVTSPDSSSQGGRGSDKKKGKQKKKKRKSGRQGGDSDRDKPYIKPEPRSPSPIAGPSYIRPNKRQRHTQAQAATYDEMAYDPAMPSGSLNYYQEAPRQDRPPMSYGTTGSAAPQGAQYGRERLEVEAHRPQYAYVRHPAEYAPGETHYSRPSSSHHDAYREVQRQYGEPPLPTARYSVRPEGEGRREPGRPQPLRILVDAYGREYIEPPRQYIRPSVAPSPMTGEPEPMYERQPGRVLSRYTAAPPHDERAVVYAQPPSPYGAQHRVIPQPESVSYDYRDSQYREYSARPVAGPAEYVQVRQAPEQRIYLESPRHYVGRAASTRPMDPASASLAAPEYRRVQSVRPEGPGMPYGTEPVASHDFKPYSAWPDQPMMPEAEGSMSSRRGPPEPAGDARSVSGREPLYMRDTRRDMYR